VPDEENFAKFKALMSNVHKKISETCQDHHAPPMMKKASEDTFSLGPSSQNKETD
jgi:hypothetical protein